MSKHNNYFLLKSQHCRYILLKENNGSLVTVETPTALLAPFQYRLISNYSNDVNNIFFYDLTTKLLAFNVKTEKFYEINLEFPKNKKDYEIMTAYIDTKGTMIFQTSDWRKNDPNRSYGYFIIENIFKLK